MIIDKDKFDPKSLDRFAYQQFKERTLRTGNVVTFVTELTGERPDDRSDGALMFMWEIPNIDWISAIAVQRLYTSILSTFIAGTVDGGLEISNDKVVVRTKHVNQGVEHETGIISTGYNVAVLGGSAVATVGFHLSPGDSSNPLAYGLSTNDKITTKEQIKDWMQHGVEGFYNMTQQLFLDVSKYSSQ